MMKESIKSNAPRFSSRRMVKEYVTRYYPSFLKAADAAYARTPATESRQPPTWGPQVQGAGDPFSS